MKFASIPVAWVDKAGKLINDTTQWLQSVLDRVQVAPQQVGRVSITGKHATIATTAIPAPALSAGVYRASYTMAVTTVGSVTSSLTVTIGWTSNAQAMSETFAPLTSNALTSEQNGQIVMSVDGNTSLTYGVAYVSNAANTCHYNFWIGVEALPS